MKRDVGCSCTTSLPRKFRSDFPARQPTVKSDPLWINSARSLNRATYSEATALRNADGLLELDRLVLPRLDRGTKADEAIASNERQKIGASRLHDRSKRPHGGGARAEENGRFFLPKALDTQSPTWCQLQGKKRKKKNGMKIFDNISWKIIHL